jgi:hypothetical protein
MTKQIQDQSNCDSALPESIGIDELLHYQDNQTIQTNCFVQNSQFVGVYVHYEYCISVILLSIRIQSRIHHCISWPSRILLGVPYALLTLILGPWGLPWGLILTIRALWVNLSGGIVVPYPHPSWNEVRLATCADQEAIAFSALLSDQQSRGFQHETDDTDRGNADPVR